MSEMQKYTCCPGTEDTYLATDVDARLALMQRAVEWLLENGVSRGNGDRGKYTGFRDSGCSCCSSCVQIPAEFADIINPESGNDR